MTFPEWLKEHEACLEGVRWVGKRGLRDAWDELQRPDWMLWLLKELGYDDKRVLRLYACWCVRRVWPLLVDARSRTVVEVTERYAVGEATAAELWAASLDAKAAARDAWAAWVAEDIGDAGDVARDATGAAAWVAQVDHLREVVPWEAVAALAAKAGIEED